MANYDHANYVPPMKGYSGQGAFRFWCQTVLPLVYDDSLSYYELLNKMVVYLNNTIQDVANVEDNVQALHDAYAQLEGYVNTYFDNLDVQDEINAKLDQMATDGDLDDLIEPFVTEQIGGVVEDQIDAVVAGQIDAVVGEQIDASVASQIATPTATATSAWLDAHVTPVGSAVVVDDSLTVSGAAADAQVVGERFNGLNVNDLLFNEMDHTSSFLSGKGTWDGAVGAWKINGEIASDTSFDLYSNTGAFPSGMVAGGTYLLHVQSSNPGYIYAQIYYRINGEWDSSTRIRFYVNGMFTIPDTATGIKIRVDIYAGTYTNEHIRIEMLNVNANAKEINKNVYYNSEDIKELIDNTLDVRTGVAVTGTTYTGYLYNYNRKTTNANFMYISYDISSYSDSEGFVVSNVYRSASANLFPPIIYWDENEKLLGYEFGERGALSISNYYINRDRIPDGTKYIVLQISTTQSTSLYTGYRVVHREPEYGRAVLYKFTASDSEFSIYVPSPFSEKYTEYVFRRVVNVSKAYDSWRIQPIYITDNELTRLYPIMAGTGVECEGAVREANASDYIGGFHGYEQLVAISFYADGSKLNITNDIPLTKCNQFEARVSSVLCHHSTSTQCLARERSDVWTKDGVVIFNHFSVLDPINVTAAPLCMLGIAKSNNDQTDIISEIVSNTNPYPIEITTAEHGTTYINTPKLRNAGFRGKLYVDLAIDDIDINDLENFSGNVITQSDNATIKIYMTPVVNHEFAVNDVFQCKAKQKIFGV